MHSMWGESWGAKSVCSKFQKRALSFPMGSKAENVAVSQKHMAASDVLERTEGRTTWARKRCLPQEHSYCLQET